MFNKTKASIHWLAQHKTSARLPYIYLYRVPNTLDISADILDFQTSETFFWRHQSAFYGFQGNIEDPIISILWKKQNISASELYMTNIYMYLPQGCILKTLSFLFFGKSNISASGLYMTQSL